MVTCRRPASPYYLKGTFSGAHNLDSAGFLECLAPFFSASLFWCSALHCSGLAGYHQRVRGRGPEGGSSRPVGRAVRVRENDAPLSSKPRVEAGMPCISEGRCEAQYSIMLMLLGMIWKLFDTTL